MSVAIVLSLRTTKKANLNIQSFKIDPQSVINSFQDSSQMTVRKIRSCPSIHINKPKGDFKIHKISEVLYNLNFQHRGFENHILIHGTNGQVLSIEGHRNSLNLLREIFDLNKGKSFELTTNSMLFPLDIAQFTKTRNQILADYEGLYKTVSKNQKIIDSMVLKLYGISKIYSNSSTHLQGSNPS